MVITCNFINVIVVVLVLISSDLVYGKGGGRGGGGRGGSGKGGGGKRHGHGYGSSSRYTSTSTHLVFVHTGYGVRTSSQDVVCLSRHNNSSNTFCSYNEQCCGETNTHCCSRSKSNNTLISWIVGITAVAMFTAFAYEIYRCVTEDDDDHRSDSSSNVSMAEICPTLQTRPGVIGPTPGNTQPSRAPLYIPLSQTEAPIPPYQHQTPPPSYPSVVPGSPQPPLNSYVETPPPAYGKVIPSMVKMETYTPNAPTPMMPETLSPSAPPIMPHQSAPPPC